MIQGHTAPKGTEPEFEPFHLDPEPVLNKYLFIHNTWVKHIPQSCSTNV